MATSLAAPSGVFSRTDDPDLTGVYVKKVGKRYWLQQQLPPTLQHTLVAMVRGAGAVPFWALRDVSFNITAGESVGLIGGNGAGKSTLLRLICGLGRPTSGQVDVRGRVAALLELGIGFNPHLTGRENLYVSAVLGGLRRREARLLFDEIVEFAELGDFIDQPLRIYSSGMQMRLAFSVAIHVDPAVLIVDEGLSVGDAHFQQKCLDRIEQFRRAGKTLIMVSHDMATVRAFCTRAIWLRRGRLVSDGPVERVVSEYESVSQQDSLNGPGPLTDVSDSE
ncbi:MAG: ABC transporter ATP-binding protein [Vicinamibacterales bacterium]